METIEYNGLKFITAEVSELTAAQVGDMHALNVELYPAFKEIYDQNKYYSYVKPDLVIMVYDINGELVADFNYGERDISELDAKLAYWGVLVRDEFQGKGIARKGHEILEKLARKRNCGLMFASSADSELKAFFEKLGYMESSYEFTYDDLSEPAKELTNFGDKGYDCYIKLLDGSVQQANDLLSMKTAKTVHLGDGPI